MINFSFEKLTVYKKRASSLLFYLILFLLPLNLGLHFVLNDSYLKGLLIDYLIPTLYVQDILVFILILLNVKTVFLGLKKASKYLIWFIFAVFLSVFVSSIFLISLVAFARLVLYVLFMLYLKQAYDYKEDFSKMLTVLATSALLLSLLALLQWRAQGSVFDNYYFFGEQPYDLSTPGINIENYFGIARVPPYATFRHPNVFAGFLSIVLFLLLSQIRKSKYLAAVFVLGTVTLFFTLAKFAWLSFLLAIVFWYLIKQGSRLALLVAAVFFLLFAVSFSLPVFDSMPLIENHPSFYRRADLLEASYSLVQKNPLFGVGYGTSTIHMERFLPPGHDILFSQPPHNIFVLLLVESGLFAFLTFTLFFSEKLKMSRTKPLLFAVLLQILFLGSFDHYFLTMHQTHLFFWFLLAFI